MKVPVFGSIFDLEGVFSLLIDYLYHLDQSPDGLQPGLSRVALVLIVSAGIGVVVLGYWAIQAERGRKLTGLDGMVGLRGIAVENITSSGRVFVNGEYWKAFVKEGVIDRGQGIEVVGVCDGLVLEVKGLGV